jgi:hypothetical protein
VARLWLDELDDRPQATGRFAELERAFTRYEMVTVPISIPTRGSGPYRSDTFRILRKKDLDLRPRLELTAPDRMLRVTVAHRAHLQIVDLRVLATDEAGRIWSMRPNGEWVEGKQVLARPGLLLYATGTRVIELLENPLPNEIGGARIIEVHAVLRNPGGSSEDEFADASESVSIRW